MRLQLALNVADLDSAVAFYSSMFATEPAKIRPGYANFAVENPPLKLVLFENPDAADSINHLGVEAESIDQVVDSQARLAGAGLAPDAVDDTVCCYAEKTETWVTAPDGQRWEWYVVRGDAEEMANRSLGALDVTAAGDDATSSEPCCAPTA